MNLLTGVKTMTDYRVVVVDDKKIIVESLAKFIENEVEGFSVVGTFRDGSEVIEFIGKNQIDVIITDVRMHNVSGIDIARYVCENNMEIEVIIISAYKSFEYAKQAMEYGVKNYLVKPTEPEELESVLKKIKASLDLKKTGDDEEEEIKDSLSEQILSREERGIQKAIEYINKNYMKPISLKDVAKEVYFSEFYFSKLFKKKINKSFTDYLVQIRMEKALELLKSRKYKVYEISKLVGYESNYFVKVFRNYTGYTPKEYARHLENSDE